MNIHSHFQLQRVSLELPEIHYIEPEDKTQYDGRENEGEKQVPGDIIWKPVLSRLFIYGNW